MMFRAGLATLLAGASLASAVSISSQCQSALEGLASGPAATCLNANGILNIAVTNPNSSIVTPFNSFLTGLCQATPCSNSTISSVVQNITSACSSDISQFGISVPSASTISAMVQQFYPTFIQGACLKASSNNTFCATSMLTNLQTALGTTLSADNIISKIPSLFLSGTSGVPANVTCTDCTKELLNVIVHADPSLNSTLNSALGSQCGASFTNGASPTGVFEATGTVTATAKSAGVVLPISRSVVAGLAISSLTAVFSAFVMLA